MQCHIATAPPCGFSATTPSAGQGSGESRSVFTINEEKTKL